MKPLITVLASLCLLSSVTPAQPASSNRLESRVDPRVELLSTIFRLSGANEYNQPLARSPYSAAVDKHFGRFRDHPVVKTAQTLRANRGVSYDAVMAMALHIKDTETLGERIPFNKSPPRLDRRWKVVEARDFLVKARSFVKETGFNAFYARHQKLFEVSARRMTELLAKRQYIAWFDRFFGSRQGARFSVVVGMLNGPCNYGSGIRFPGGTEEISPIIGAARFDRAGNPVFGDDIVPTIVHEFCHTYTNPLAEKHAESLEKAGKQIFQHCAHVMRRQAYGDWLTMMKETLVRTCVARYVLANDGIEAAAREVKRQHQKGFEWVGELSDLLGRYETGRERYKTFDSFMPEVARFMKAYAARYEGRKRNAPKVVSIIPANGSKDVDPGLTEIKVVFDRPMTDGNWSVVGGGPDFPETTGKSRYDAEKLVFTMSVRLKPGWKYHFWLNRKPYESFMSAEGVPLQSVEVTFETRKK